MKPTNMPRQTHFIGVRVPDTLTETLENCRRSMHEAYGCTSGYGTPIHVTLVPPFHLDEPYTTADLVSAIHTALQAADCRFTAHVENFSGFGDRTIFAHVIQSASWTTLRDTVLSAVLNRIPGCTRKDDRPFQPHLTVANRDIPPGILPEALSVLNELKLNEDFPVDTVTIFEYKNHIWKTTASIEMNRGS